MKPSHLEALSAFFDGECVDTALLAEALADPRAPSVLLEFATYRSWLRQDGSRPHGEFYARMNRLLHRSPLVARPLVRLSMAAGLTLAAAIVGFAVRPLFEHPAPVTRPSLTAATAIAPPNDARPVGFHEWREAK
jgi:negative regulator of sigma E activity